MIHLSDSLLPAHSSRTFRTWRPFYVFSDATKVQTECHARGGGRDERACQHDRRWCRSCSSTANVQRCCANCDATAPGDDLSQAYSHHFHTAVRAATSCGPSYIEAPKPGWSRGGPLLQDAVRLSGGENLILQRVLAASSSLADRAGGLLWRLPSFHPILSAPALHSCLIGASDVHMPPDPSTSIDSHYGVAISSIDSAGSSPISDFPFVN